MLAAKLNAQGVRAFMHLIPEDVAKEIGQSISRHPDEAGIGDEFAVYGAYNEELELPRGAMVLQRSGDSLILRSLFVEADSREMGAAGLMLQEVLRDALYADDIEGIEYLAAEDSPEQMEVAEFLARRGFARDEAEEKYFITSLSDILAAGRLSKAPEGGAEALKEVSPAALRSLSNELSGKETTFVPLPINKEDYEEELSMVTMKDGAIRDLVLLEKDEEGLVLSYALSRGNGLGVMTALAAALRRAEKKYGADCALRIPTVTLSGEHLVEKIVPGASCKSFVHCHYSLLPLYKAAFGEGKGR
ncbi:MAG: hypothetical protein IK115_02015 [Lachnospiraceae bacterium]|nr:hypothetical protein [Lachnospiraceae bacterium]